LTSLARIAFIGNSLPRRCGIATFTTDLRTSVKASIADIVTGIVAMNDSGSRYSYPASVLFTVNDADLGDYIEAAAFLNSQHFDVVSLQHEFGIFGGEAGSHILALLSRLRMPLVTTFHTVLAHPKAAQRAVMNRIIALSSKVVVMAEKGRELLLTVYGVPLEKIEIIPHGIPDAPFVEPDRTKAELGFAGQPVILTFGLLSPNKGIEVMIDAMPRILEGTPDAIYVVLGATHPNLVRDQGEEYRASLLDRTKELGIEEHVVFLDQFVDQATLLRYITMCDVYVTPYLTEAQMTSGTLAYSFGLGKAVVSTPYWHARELLGEGRGVLVPFGAVDAIGKEVADLLTDDIRRNTMRRLAYASSRSMTWAMIAQRYLAVFQSVRQKQQHLKLVASRDPKDHSMPNDHPPEIQTGYFLSMCDDTGLFQHAVNAVPDRSHGYCVDDNARALLVACTLNASSGERLSQALTSRFASFIQHAWNPDRNRFRNFMSFDRRWLEESGSEDSHGRTLWALGVCAARDTDPARREWAAVLFARALSIVERFRSPRACAFTLLGLGAVTAAGTAHPGMLRMQRLLANKLQAIFLAVETADWVWFEEGLSYDNARLCQAMIVTGLALKDDKCIDTGLRSLRWLTKMQTSPAGNFRPVGSHSFGDQRQKPKAFDQQPLEAAAMISACAAAFQADGKASWDTEAMRAFSWFTGKNDLGLSLVDVTIGSCCDGLHPDRRNENCGGESVVSYLLALFEIRQIALRGDTRLKEVRLPAYSV
jgi:glycosyltransferase involved in cell wall biosynthesis